MPLTVNQIQNAYVAFFNRPADTAGLNYWSSYAGDATALLNTFALSAEYTSLYAGMNNTQIVNTVYGNLFGRDSDLAGLNYWVGQLTAGNLKIGNIADAINKGAQGVDATAVANKTTAATSFTNSLDTVAKVIAYSSVSSSGLAAVKTWLSGVTTTASLTTATSSAGLTAITSTVSSNVSATGQTFTLTTSMENISGTGGNDQIYGTVSTSSTLNSFDVIDGGSGTDTLHVTLNGASYAADSTIRNIEVINVRASTAHNFNANALTGITNMTLEGSVAASSFTNVGSAATAIGMRNIADAAANLTVVFSDAAMTGTNDAVTVNLNAAGDAGNSPTLLVKTTASTNGAETLNVVTSGTASVLAQLRSATNAAVIADNQGVQTANAVLKTLKVTGDQNLTVTTALEFAADTGTVDASTFTGKLSIGLDVGGIVSVTGGTADDTLSFTTGLTVDDTVNGGAGIDTISVTNMDTFTLASFTKVTNIEVIDQISTAGNALVLTTGGAALTRAILRENATDGVNITASDLAAGGC